MAKQTVKLLTPPTLFKLLKLKVKNGNWLKFLPLNIYNTLEIPKTRNRHIFSRTGLTIKIYIFLEHATHTVAHTTLKIERNYMNLPIIVTPNVINSIIPEYLCK